jgi:hypothetical protein
MNADFGFLIEGEIWVVHGRMAFVGMWGAKTCNFALASR